MQNRWLRPRSPLANLPNTLRSAVPRLLLYLGQRYTNLMTARHVGRPPLNVGDFAKILKSNGIDIGPRRLFAWLREHGWLIKAKGSSWNMPTQKAMDLHLFEIKETTISHSDGHTTINKEL